MLSRPSSKVVKLLGIMQSHGALISIHSVPSRSALSCNEHTFAQGLIRTPLSLSLYNTTHLLILPTHPGYIGEFEIIDDHRLSDVFVQFFGRLDKTGVISPCPIIGHP